MTQKYGNDGQNDRKKTPPKWQQPPDANKSGGQYPNYFVWQTRTGNIPLRVDDTKGNESISMQHRSGSMIQFLPNGGIQTVASKGKTDVTFGQHRSLVTGAQDTTVRGHSSHKTEGSRRTTTNGDKEDTVKGKQVSSCKSLNMTCAEQFDIAAQAGYIAGDKGLLLTSPNGPAALATTGGTASVSSETGTAAISSKGGSTTINAGKEIAAKAGNGFHVNGGPEVVVNGNEVHVKAGSAMIVMKEGKIYLNSGDAIAKTAKDLEAVVTSVAPSPVKKE